MPRLEGSINPDADDLTLAQLPRHLTAFPLSHNAVDSTIARLSNAGVDPYGRILVGPTTKPPVVGCSDSQTRHLICVREV